MSKQSTQSDEQIVESVRSHDKQLYAEIIRRYEKKLLRYTIFLIRDEEIAADVVQESFIKAYQNLNSFNTSRKFSSWLYRIVHNQAMNMVSKKRQHLSTDDAVDVDSKINLENDFIRKELHQHLHHCLSQMPSLYKDTLVLFFLEEKSYEEISDILRISIGTVGTRLNRAKQLIQKICQRTK